MKKILTLVSVIGMFTFVSCGPSAAEIEAKAKLAADSVSAATAAAEAEVAAKAAAEAEIVALKEKATADSIAAATAAAATVKPVEKSKSTPKKTTTPATVKSGDGRG